MLQVHPNESIGLAEHLLAWYQDKSIWKEKDCNFNYHMYDPLSVCTKGVKLPFPAEVNQPHFLCGNGERDPFVQTVCLLSYVIKLNKNMVRWVVGEC